MIFNVFLLCVSPILQTFYKMDLYERNYEMAQDFFNFIEVMSVPCDVFNDDYNGEKYACKLPDLPDKFRDLILSAESKK